MKMQLIPRLIVSLLCCCIYPAILAQTPHSEVKGRVIDSKTEESIPYATVGAEQNDSILVRVAADANGVFRLNLPEGKYGLSISSVGYATLYQEIEVPANAQPVDLGKLSLTEGTALQEVTVQAMRPLIRSDVDKVTYAVEADPEAISNNLLEMMRKVPLLSVDAEDNITLNGQSNFKILMNGKNSSLLSGSNVKDILKSIPANTIKDIEVITNPPSKYEAEGIGGIINIITTSRRELNGLTGTIGLRGDIRGGFGGNLYLMGQTGKFTMSGSYFIQRFRSPEGYNRTESELENFLSDDYRYNNSRQEYSYKGLSQGLNLEGSYEIDSLNLLTLSVQGYLGNNRMNLQLNSVESNVERTPMREFLNHTNSRNSWGYVSGNLDYQHSFRKPEQMLTASYRFELNPNGSEYKQDIENILNYPGYHQESDNDAQGMEHTFQIDYIDPITPMHQIEGGAKYILRQNTSNSSGFKLPESETEALPIPINDLDYTQHILGIYGGYTLRIKKWSAKAGFRLETTWNDIHFKNENPTTADNTLFNIIPYVSAAWQVKENQTLKVGYTQRMQRPGIWYLNPYLNDSDPLNISQGNPDLESEITHSVSADYSYFTPKFNLMAGLQGRFRDNGIEEFSSIDPNGVRYTTYENIGKQQVYSANLYLSWTIARPLVVDFNGTVGYLHVESKAKGMENDGIVHNCYLGIRWNAWKNGSIRANAGCGSQSISLQNSGMFYYWTGFSINQSFLKNKLNVNLSISDPFEKWKTFRQEYTDPTYRMKQTYQMRNFQVYLGVSYTFGKMNSYVKKARRSITNDDVTGGGQKGNSSSGASM